MLLFRNANLGGKKLQNPISYVCRQIEISKCFLPMTKKAKKLKYHPLDFSLTMLELAVAFKQIKN